MLTLRAYSTLRSMGGSFWTYLKLLTAIERIIFQTDCYDEQTVDRIVPSAITYTIRPAQAYRAGQIEIGFCLLSRLMIRIQHGGPNLPLEIRFGNAAPRAPKSARREAVPMVAAYFPAANFLYVGTGGLCLSWVKHLIDPARAWVLKVTERNTDYRSAHIPKAFERLLNGDPTVVESKLDFAIIPDAPTLDEVVNVDSFGNVIMQFHEDALTGFCVGDEIEITIGERSVRALLGEKLGDAEEGGLVLAVGSTGRDCGINHDRQILYLYKQGGDASEEFRTRPSGPAILCGTSCSFRRVPAAAVA